MTIDPRIVPGAKLPNPYNRAEDWTIVSVDADRNENVVRWADGTETVGTCDGSGMRYALELLDIRERGAELDKIMPPERRGPINTESPAGQAFSRFCAGELNISAMSRLERDEFASVARMWLDTPAIANPRNPEDAPLPGFLRDFVAALEAPKTRELKSSELRRGMIVWCSGMRCLIDGEIHSRESTQGKPEDADLWPVYWTVALVLNRDDVPARAVPLSFTQPRLRNGRADEAAIARGEHRWSIQGNDNARWCVESD